MVPAAPIDSAMKVSEFRRRPMSDRIHSGVGQPQLPSCPWPRISIPLAPLARTPQTHTIDRWADQICSCQNRGPFLKRTCTRRMRDTMSWKPRRPQRMIVLSRLNLGWEPSRNSIRLDLRLSGVGQTWWCAHNASQYTYAASRALTLDRESVTIERLG